MFGVKKRLGATRRTVALAAPLVVLAGLLPAEAGASALDDATPPVQLAGRLQSAAWRWAEKLPDGRPFRQLGPLVVLTLGADGGASVWAGQWSTNQPVRGEVALRFTGVPAGIRILPARFPAGVVQKSRAAACSGAECRIRLPKGADGQQTLTSAVAFHGSKRLAAGVHKVTVALVVNGTPVPEAEETVYLEAVKRTPTDFYVTRVGQSIVTSGQPAVHRLSAYRLSGPATADKGELALANVLDRRLRAAVTVKGSGWGCGQGRCSIRAGVPVGTRAPPLGLLWRIENRHVKAWPRIAAAKAHDATWWTRYSFNGDVKGRLRQQSSLILAKKAPTPQFTNSKQVLAPTRRAQVTTMVQQLGPARMRGDGLFAVQVGNGGSRDARDLRLRIRPPRHTTITRIDDPAKWECAGDVCRWRGVLKKKRTLPPVTVQVASAQTAKVAARTQPFVAVASWTAAKQKGRRTDRGVSKKAWLKPLRVSALATNAVVHSRSGITTQLQAEVANTDGSQVHYRWKQIAGPSVTWVGPRSGAVSGSTAGARFTPPKVTKRTTLRFRVAVTATGARATETVSVRAVPAGVKGATWNPQTKSTVPLTPQQATEKLNDPKNPSTYQPLDTKAAARAIINKPGVTVARPGQRITLRVNKRKFVKDAKVLRTTWAVNGRKPSKSLKPTVSPKGRTLTITVPKRQRATVHVVASLFLNKGRRVDIGELVVLRSVVPRPVPGAQLATAFSGLTFCDFFGDLSPSDTFTIGGITFTASAVVPTGSSCSTPGASLTVTAESVDANGVILSDLSMTMTSSSITLSAGSITLPDGPDGSLDPIDLTGSLTASWTSSGPSALTGSFTASNLSTLPYLQLPDGWAVPTGTFTFSVASGDSSFSLSITATGANQGQAQLSGSIASDGSFSLSASMANALTLTGYDGSQAAFGGSGSVARSSSGAFTYDVDLGMTTTTFEIINDVSLGSASLQWDNSGLTLSGSVTTGIGSDSVVFSASATITNFSTWTATISTTATPSVGSLPLISLTGTFGYASSAFTFDVSASVTVADVSSFLDLTLTTASASILNSCPASDSSCDSSDLRLELDVAGSVDLFNDTIAISTTVDVDLTTGQFDADFSLAGADFGPSEAQLNDVSFFVADDGAADPNLAGNPCAPSGSGTVYGFTATATILSDVDFAVTGVYQGGTSANPAGTGYCFYGQVTTSDISQLNGAGLADSLNFVYSTYATTADGQNIPATSPTMWATMELPSQVQTYIGNAVSGFTVLIELVTTNGSVTGLTIDGMVDMQAYVAGSATELPSFELTSIGVSLQVSTGSSSSVEVSFDSDALLTTPGNSAGSMTQSVMDFTASIGITTANGGSLNLTANLDSASPVANAFGVQGLTIQQMGIAANIGFDALVNSSLTVSATNLELPSTIAGPIGLSSTAPIDFSLTVGVVAPCFYISVGTPDQSTDVAVDWGGAGVLEAYYFQLLLAPFGNCTLSDGTKITGNFAVDFDGYIFGDEVDINGEVEITPEFSADISIDVGGFNLAGMSLQTTIIDLDFDPAGGVFDLNFSGGANLWSAIIVQVSGTVDVDLGATSDNLDIVFDGAMSENLFGLFTSAIDVDIDVDAGQTDGTFYLDTLDISLSGDVKVLIFEANASFTLDYSDGAVQTLSGSFGASIDLFIISFGVQVAFSYDPAVTGNEDMAITITGWMKIDLWLFSIKTSVSLTIDVDASFLASSQYQPQPTQQVNAPTSLVSGSANTNPNTWSWNTAMYQANNFGWMANLVSNYQAVSDAVNASTVNTANDAFDQIWNAAYLTGSSEWTRSMPAPASYPWLGSNSWPGAYMSNVDSNFSVVPTQGTGTIGNSTDPQSTNSQLEVTATLPPSPLAQMWTSSAMELQYESQYSGGGVDTDDPSSLADVYVPSAACVTGNTTKTWSVQIPDVANPTPSNWSWVILDTNWRLYGSSLRETADTLLNGFADGMPSMADWLSNTSEVIQDTTVPIPVLESMVADGFTFDCGYTDFTTQTSLYDFMSQQSIPWSALPPTFDANEYSDSSLQPGWGQGWQPYNLANTQYSNLQAYNIWIDDNDWASEDLFPCTNGVPSGQVNLTTINPVGQLWGDPNDSWVDIPEGGYVELQASSSTGNPWSLHLYNSSGQELQWNGSAWVTAPSGGFTSAYAPLSAAGQLYGMDSDAVVYWSSNNNMTYLVFSSSNAISAQTASGVSNPVYSYLPDPAMNDCSTGQAIYNNPNAVQGTTLTAPPTFASLTTFSFGASQVFQDGPLPYPVCSNGSPEPFTTTMTGGAVTNAAGVSVDLAADNWTLGLQNSGGAWSLHLHDVANQELRYSGGQWITEPSGGWPSDAAVFAPDVTLYGATATGVYAGYPGLYLWFSPNNPMSSGGGSSLTMTYTPDPGLNSCASGFAQYSGA